MKQVYPISKYTLYPFVKLFIRSIAGLENLNQDGGYIVAANHQSYADDPIFATLVIFSANKKMQIIYYADCAPLLILNLKE